MSRPAAIAIVLGAAVVAAVLCACAPHRGWAVAGRLGTRQADGFGRLDLRSTRERLVFQELINLTATRTAGRQQRLSEDTAAIPTPLWLALIFGGCVALTVRS